MHRSLASALLVVTACSGAGTRTAAPTTCPIDRTIALGTQDEVQAFAGCTTASAMTIRTGATIQLGPLGQLETITGDLVIGPTVGLEEISLLELREVGGSIEVVSNSSLRGLFFPRLEKAGRISIEGNSALMTVSMPRLTDVSGSLLITEDTSLELIDLSALASVGKDLVITDNPKLSLIEAGNLARVQEVRVERNRVLPPEQVDALRAKTPPP